MEEAVRCMYQKCGFVIEVGAVIVKLSKIV